MKAQRTHRSLLRLAAVGLATSFALMGSAPATSQHEDGGCGGGGGGGGGGGHAEGGYTSPSALFRIDLGGGAAVKLTQDFEGYLTCVDTGPDVDQAGNIVFSSTRPATSDGTTDAELYLLRADGTVEQLTDNATYPSEETGAEQPIDELNPVFSPDGTKVAYEAPPLTGEGDPEGLAGAQIWILDLGTLVSARLTEFQASAGAAKQPTWSPDGTEIAFTLGDGQQSHIVRMDLGTKAIADVTVEGSHDSHASWHPGDPDLVAFTHRAGSRADVYVRNLATGGLSPVAETPGLAESRPAWSPDGSLIAYQQGDESLGAAVWTMRADGSDKNGLTKPGLWSDRNPTFVDGDTLVYESTEGAPPVADLAIAKAADRASVRAGRKVAYTISVSNNGVLTGPDVEVVDTLPAGMSYVDAEVAYAPPAHGEEEEAPPDATIEVDGRTVRFGLGDLAKGEPSGTAVATITLVARAPLRPGSYTNRAVVRVNPPAGDDLVDPVAANDTASVTTTVLSAPIVGTSGDDVLVGTPGDDVLKGLGGDDVVHGLGGSDRLVGGAGADVLKGGSGSDLLVGKGGNDRLLAGKGRDVLKGLGGHDVLKGGDGSDRIKGGSNRDAILARDGHRDAVYGGRGRDVATVDRGLDRVTAVELVR